MRKAELLERFHDLTGRREKTVGTTRPMVPEAGSELTVAALREMLRSNGLPVSGRKQVLVDRLRGLRSSTLQMDESEWGGGGGWGGQLSLEPTQTRTRVRRQKIGTQTGSLAERTRALAAQTVKELRATLKERGLPLKGNKITLVARLHLALVEEARYAEEVPRDFISPTSPTKRTLSDLKTELRRRGLPVSGRKAELIARLKDNPPLSDQPP